MENNDFSTVIANIVILHNGKDLHFSFNHSLDENSMKNLLISLHDYLGKVIEKANEKIPENN